MDRNVVAAILLSAGAIAPGLESGAQETSTQTLIKRLSSSHYATRETAFKELKKMNGPALEKELLKTTVVDLEAKRRIDCLLEPYHERQVRVRVEEVIKACKGKLPWVDGFDDRCAVNYYYALAEDGKDNGSPEWGKYRRATELLLMDASKQGYALNPIVEQLKQRHDNWLRNSRLPPEYDK